VSLGDTSALDEWRRREAPSERIWHVVDAWVQRLADASWQAPSIPLQELSFSPESEVRSATVPDSDGVEVYYRYDFATDVVDLIWVGPPPNDSG